MEHLHYHVAMVSAILVAGLGQFACAAQQPYKQSELMSEKRAADLEEENVLRAQGLEIATLGAGCFWCVEAVLQRLPGIRSVTSGYMGGDLHDPSYEAVVTGRTGHAEVAQVVYNPEEIGYDALLEIFWRMHDPTTLNRQGADRGTQYRSVVFYHTPQQKEVAEASLRAVDRSGAFRDPIVTEIAKAGPFYPAESYHQNYYKSNREAPYCRYVILPKLKKLGLEDE